MKVFDDELSARLFIWRVSGIGPVMIQRLLGYFGSIQQALQHNASELNKAGLKPDLIQAMQDQAESTAQADLDWLAKASHRHILLLEDPRYPALLRDTKAAPPLLFVAGNPDLLNDPQIAIVGSRNPSHSGLDNAKAFAHHLAGNGLGITSGLALGIDTASHQGALEAQGSTIAVIGTGLDIIYPASNRRLAEQIVEQGAIVSEFPIGTKPQAHNFPRRNRVISGMALGTLVVEATLQSGSLVTAQHAMEQGREVFAIPGSIHNPMARGCHRLIRQGAKLVETAGDILEEMAPQLHAFLQTTPLTTTTHELSSNLKPSSKTSAPSTYWQADEVLDEENQQLLAALGFDPIPIDQLVLRTGLTTEVVSSMLLMLELQGLVSSCGGGHYLRLKPRD